MAAAFLYISYEFLAAPGVWGGNTLAYGYILTTLAAGIVIYAVSNVYHKKSGLDLSLLFREIPPE
jgi:hypothetical protein